MMRVDYDEEADFLEIAVREPTACYAEEVQPGVLVRKDESTDEIKSVGVAGFRERVGEGLELPVNVSLSSI